MSIKRTLGSGHASGSPSFTGLGAAVQTAQQEPHLEDKHQKKIYLGFLKDIRMPYSARDSRQDRLPGCWIKIEFDHGQLSNEVKNRWYRLGDSAYSLMTQYGTEDSIKSLGLRVRLELSGVSFSRARAYIVGDGNNELTFRGIDTTPVAAFADVFSGLASAKFPTS